MSQQPSGIDLARAALAAARASAKTRPAQQQKKPRSTRRSSGRQPGDPMGLGAAINRLMDDRGWEPPERGGSILDQWPTIAPELADKVAAVRFEHNTGILHLRPASPAYATQLRLHQAQILAKVQEAAVGRSVRALKILTAGTAPTQVGEEQQPTAPTAEAEPVRTRETACSGIQNVRALLLEYKPEKPAPNLYLEAARERQIAALRANRQPEDQHREAYWAQAEAAADPAPGSMAASERAALARKRQEQTGQPRRAFDVA